LVPGVAIFGLVGGRSVEPLITVCFVAFLSAGLVVLCYGMLLSTPTFRGLRWWRGRHWLSLGGLIAAVLFLAYVLFLPVSAYLTQYRWPAMMAAFGTTTGMPLTYRSEARQARSYQVGRGPIALTEIPIFSFVGEPAEFWRGQAFDVYVGNGWVTSELEEPGILPKGNTLDLTGAREFRARPWARVLTHEVRAEEALPFILYSPGQMQRVVARPPIRLSQVHGLQVDAYGCAAAPRSRMPRGATYRVVSAPLELSVVRLRGVGNSDAGGTGGDPSESGGPPPISLASSYLSVPVGARRVADAALQLVGQEPSPAHKLLALVAYLQQQCVYTMSAPAIPPGRDAADYFLFQQKRGYCDLFATTLALMGRAVGVPTRLVTGYAYPGPPVPGEAGEEPERTYVREVDGHAWVEAYVLPWGWISVDATPAGASAPMPALRRFWLGLRFFWEDHPLTVGILALAVLSVVAFGVLRLRGALWREHGSADRGHLDSAARGIVLRTYADLSRLFRRLGHPRLATQTPLEYLASLEDLGRDDQVGGKDGRARRRAMIASVLAGARALTQLFLLARYAPDPVSEESAVRAQDTLRNIRRELRTRRR
jgi:hypothetical protein